MRPLKFRAWNKFAKKMIYFDSPRFDVEYRYFCFEMKRDQNDYPSDLPGAYSKLDDDSVMGTYPTDTEEIGDWEVMQYTGLKDRNGKEIYESDIVIFGQKHWHKENEGHSDIRDHAGVVIYVAPEYFASNLNPVEGYCSHCCPSLNESVIIIGNIYENKNLLKK